jgi:hypothetical protein
VKAWEVEPGDFIIFSDGLPRKVEWIDDGINTITFHCFDHFISLHGDDEVKVP